MASPMNMLWGNLLHLSYNMWADRPTNQRTEYITAEPRLRFDQTLWDDLQLHMTSAGMNLVVLDLGDGVRYESHPEIAVQGAWSVTKLKEELAKARALGLEVIPKWKPTLEACRDRHLRAIEQVRQVRLAQGGER